MQPGDGHQCVGVVAGIHLTGNWGLVAAVPGGVVAPCVGISLLKAETAAITGWRSVPLQRELFYAHSVVNSASCFCGGEISIMIEEVRGPLGFETTDTHMYEGLGDVGVVSGDLPRLQDPPSLEVAVVASQAVMKETKAVVGENVPAVAPVPQNVVAGWEALAGMGTVVAASAPSVNACSIVSSAPSPIMPSNSLWLQPLWMQMELLQQGCVPGLTIGADPKELYICFV